ncbi:MAG: hypothetical protein AB7E61_00445 [Acholeplasmataceae bacterium]
MKYKSREANDKEIKVITSNPWIELKAIKLLSKVNQKYLGNKLYKVVSNKETIVFIKKDESYLVLEDSSKEIALHIQNKYLKWSGDQVPQFNEYFGYLINEYGFNYAAKVYRSAVTEENKFFYHGPVNIHSLYNDDICINFVCLVQRQEWDVYITEEYQDNQAYIRSGRYVSDGFKALKTYDDNEIRHLFKYGYVYSIAHYIKKDIQQYNEIYGVRIIGKYVKERI